MTKLVIDTNALVWATTDAAKLGRRARREIEKSVGQRKAHVSAVSFWETSLLDHRQRLKLGMTTVKWRQGVLASGIVELPLTGLEAIDAAMIEGLPDPADRFIVATARVAHARLVTADQRILSWKGDLDRLDAQS
ncbi:MAG: type II toxin-antitoxin system VapC family toxin [Hyphomicrobiaceae bacterium]